MISDSRSLCRAQCKWNKFFLLNFTERKGREGKKRKIRKGKKKEKKRKEKRKEKKNEFLVAKMPGLAWGDF